MVPENILHGRFLEIPIGGVSKVKVFKRKYGAKLEFPEGVGGWSKPNDLLRGGGGVTMHSLSMDFTPTMFQNKKIILMV